jgi:Ni/Fe-hydrogenase subunit HybB-like protein
LAFCLVTGDFFYSQFLVIWFGDLPHETRYVLLRVRESPWDLLAWTVLFVCFAIPFVVLLSRNLKQKPAFMMVLAVIILIGMWLERFLLIVPSLWKEGYIPLGLMELLITAGFFGIVALCVLLFLQKFPIFPLADPLFRENLR